MKRIKNFSAGPAVLPLSVLKEAQEDFLDYQSTGKSLIETSHRSKEYDAVHQEARNLLLELLKLDDNYTVAFFGGGASSQFAMVAMNLLSQGKKADYLLTGAWSEKAAKEARLFGDVHLAYDPEGNYTKVPTLGDCHFSDNAAYVHLTSNNTIFGTQYHHYFDTKAPLIADMSSDFLWAPFDAKKFDMIYAGAQKNIGPAGVTVVVIKKELLAACNKNIPSMFDYNLQTKKESLYNTPPVFPIYIVGKVLKWVKNEGGLAAMKTRNDKKAGLLYKTIDENADFFKCPVEKDSRSTMNVVFRLPSEDLEKEFIAQAAKEDLMSLKGHRSVGGIRASIYNAAEYEWIEALTSFMVEFKRKNG